MALLGGCRLRLYLSNCRLRDLRWLSGWVQCLPVIFGALSQLPVRVLHLLEFGCSSSLVIDFGRRLDWDQFRRLAWIGGASVVAVLTLYQFMAVNASFKQMASPAIGSRMSQFVTDIPGEVEEVLRLGAAQIPNGPGFS